MKRGVEIFLTFSKPAGGFRFLETLEQRIPDGSQQAYREAVHALVDFTVRQKGDEIEKTLLADQFTPFQKEIINEYIGGKYPDMKVVRQFWERQPVMGVGAMKRLNFETSCGPLPNGVHALPSRLRDQGIQLFNGAGVDSKDGIFTHKQKVASEKAQNLS